MKFHGAPSFTYKVPWCSFVQLSSSMIQRNQFLRVITLIHGFFFSILLKQVWMSLVNLITGMNILVTMDAYMLQFTIYHIRPCIRMLYISYKALKDQHDPIYCYKNSIIWSYLCQVCGWAVFSPCDGSLLNLGHSLDPQVR